MNIGVSRRHIVAAGLVVVLALMSMPLGLRVVEAAAPGTPTNLSVVVKVGSVELDWDAPSGGTAPTGYEVQRRTGWHSGSGSYVTRRTTDDSTTNYTDSTGNASTVYFYRVRAINADGKSRWLNRGRIRTPANAVPPKPHSFRITTNSNPPVLTWKISGQYSNHGVTEMKVLRREVGLHAVGTFLEHATVNAVGGTRNYSYTDNSVQSGKRYLYRLRSINGAGSSKGTPYRGVSIP